MRWLLLILGILVLVIGVVAHFRQASLANEYQEQEREAQRQATIREAQARENPGRPIVTYEEPEDPSGKAFLQGEFYLMFPAIVWLLAGAFVTILGLAVLLVSRRGKSKDVGASAT